MALPCGVSRAPAAPELAPLLLPRPHPQYVLLLWLSMLVLIPFDIAIVDSSLAAEAAVPAAADGSGPAAAGGSSGAAAQAGAGRQGGGGAIDDALALLVLPQDVPPIVGTILSLCQRHLASPGSTREMAAVVVGRLLTRPDMAPALAAFLPWGCAALGSQDSQRASFLVPGEASRAREVVVGVVGVLRSMALPVRLL